jgi:hypothetical protein
LTQPAEQTKHPPDTTPNDLVSLTQISLSLLVFLLLPFLFVIPEGNLLLLLLLFLPLLFLLVIPYGFASVAAVAVAVALCLSIPHSNPVISTEGGALAAAVEKPAFHRDRQTSKNAVFLLSSPKGICCCCSPQRRRH